MPLPKVLSSSNYFRLACQAGLIVILLLCIAGESVLGKGMLPVACGVLAILSFVFVLFQSKHEKNDLAEEQLELATKAQELLEKAEQIKSMDEVMRLTFEDLQQKQDHLARSEKSLKGRIEAINRTMCVCEIDLKGRIVEANNAILQILKYEREELVGKHYTQIADKSFLDSDIYEVILISLESQIGYSGDVKVLGKDAEVWFNLTLTPIFTAHERLERVVVLANDISIAKRRNIEYEARIKAISQFSAVAEFDLVGHFLHANELFLDLFGYTLTQIRKKTYFELIDLAHEQTIQTVWARICDGNYIEGEYLHGQARNQELWLNCSYTPIKDTNGTPFKIIMLATDISKRKKAQKITQDTLDILRETEAELLEAQEIAGLGNWELNFITQETKWSPQVYKQFGWNINTPPPLPNEDYMQFLHPDDSAHMVKMMSSKRDAAALDFTQRIFDSEGKTKYLLIRAKPILSAKNKKVIGYHGTSLDITEITKSNQKLTQLSLVASKTSNGVIIADSKGMVIWINEGFTRITGYTLEDVMGKKPGYILQGEQTDPAHINALRQGLASQKSFQTEILNYHKNGVSYWVDILITPIFDENGVLQQYIGIETDITERKKYELQIRHQNEDIMASIEYAKRIQMATLPTKDAFQEHFTDSFVVYMPKDVVSGDFYWFEVIGENLFVISADCTGHGVPGAFMSMLGNEILHEVIGIREIYTPKEIISHVHLNIRKALKQNENKNHEGMDLGIVVINKNTQTLEFAGAKHDLIYVQNEQVIEIRGNRKGVGGYEIEKIMDYDQHTIQLDDNTSFYLHSDGYLDQFGGKQGKKFMASRFKQMIEHHHTLSMTSQGEIFHDTILQWRTEGGYNQIDDIMVLGIKI